jgi:hypothetical protein
MTSTAPEKLAHRMDAAAFEETLKRVAPKDRPTPNEEAKG